MDLPDFHPLRTGHVPGRTFPRFLVEASRLAVPSGRLEVSDPAMGMGRHEMVFAVPPGEHRVVVTVIDEGPNKFGPGHEPAYLSVLLSDAPTVRHGALPTLADPDLGPGEYAALAVDGAHVGLVDAEAARRLLPWDARLGRCALEDVQLGWYGAQMDPAHIAKGIANLPLPGATRGENVVLCTSGYGDGGYPVVGSFGEWGQLVALHLDFLIDQPED